MLVTPDNFAESLREVEKWPVMAVDTETTGLHPFKGDRMAGISVSNREGDSYYYPFRHETGTNLSMDKLPYIGSQLNDPAKTYIGFNYKFDMLHLLMDGIQLPSKVADASLAFHMLHENEKKGRSLENLSLRFVGSGDEANRKLTALLESKGLDKGGISKLSPEQVEEYACDDARYTFWLHDILEKKIKDEGTQDVYDGVCEYLLTLTELQYNGMHIDIPLIKEQMEQIEPTISRILKEMRERSDKEDLNPNSPQQMGEILGLPSTRKEILESLIDNDYTPADQKRMMELLIEWRQWKKMEGSYYYPYLYHAGADDCLHGNIRIDTTLTGRASCGEGEDKETGTPGLNLQAIPRGDSPAAQGVKRVFDAREDHYFVSADYSQAELRLLAHHIKDDKMIEMFKSGMDFHGQTAQQMGIPRDAAKRINFGIVYGLGVKGLAERLNISKNQAAAYLKAYHNDRPGVRMLMRGCENEALNNGQISMWTGRLRHFNHPSADEHKAMSSLIQGGVGEIVRVKMNELRDAFKHTGLIMTMQVHDSVIFEIPKSMGEEPLDTIREIMEDVAFHCPFKVDIVRGERWSEAT